MLSSLKKPGIMTPLLLESELSLCSNVRHGLDDRTNPRLSRTQSEFSRTILGATPSSCVSLPKFDSPVLLFILFLFYFVHPSLLVVCILQVQLLVKLTYRF